MGDQDVLNAYGSAFPQRIRVLPCTMNQRSDSACYDGFPIILHGNRGISNDTTSTYAYLYNVVGAAQRVFMLGSS